MDQHASLLERIKADSLAARKARLADKSSFLTTLLSEASALGKNKANRPSTDEEVLAVCEKFDKNIAELLSARPAEPSALAERAWLASYLPVKLDEAALGALISEVAASLGLASIGGKDIGSIMAGLNARAPNQFDRALASKLIKGSAKAA